MKLFLIGLTVLIVAQTATALDCRSCIFMEITSDHPDLIKQAAMGILQQAEGWDTVCPDNSPNVTVTECEDDESTCATYHMTIDARAEIPVMPAIDMKALVTFRGCAEAEKECTDDVDDAIPGLQGIADDLSNQAANVTLSNPEGVVCYCEGNSCNGQKAADIKKDDTSAATNHQVALFTVPVMLAAALLL